MPNPFRPVMRSDPLAVCRAAGRTGPPVMDEFDRAGRRPGRALAAAALVLAASIVASASGRANDGVRAWPDTLAAHGGPVKSVGIDGTRALTASFDYAANLWDLSGEAPRVVHRLIGHRAAVNDAAFAGDAAITASDDGSVMLWNLASGEAIARHETAGEKAMAVAVAPDGKLAASAHWDDTARLYDVATGALVAVLEAHDAPVNDVAFAPDGVALFTASSDGTVREWSLDDPADPTPRPFADHGWGVGTLAAFERGGEAWLAWGTTDGAVRAAPIAAPHLSEDVARSTRPIMVLAVSPDGTRLAVGDGAGTARVLAVDDWRELATIARPGPVWGLAFADEAHLYLAGLDDRVFLWRAEPNAPLATAPEAFPRRFHPRGPSYDDPVLALGEMQFARKCSVCHTLTPDDANRAGPTLHGIFGRPVASLPGYPYSDAMRSLDILWTEETVGALFEHGPDDYTPGSKMPMQRITDRAEREALIAYLRKTTREAPR